MEITMNTQRSLYYVRTGKAVQCFGFENIFETLVELRNRLANAGVLHPEPQTGEMGSIAQFRSYQAALQAYKRIQDKETWYLPRVPSRIRKVLEHYRKKGTPVRLFYGNSETGRDSLVERETIGSIRRSIGPQMIPLLVPFNQTGGYAVDPTSIVRLVDLELHADVYRHPSYHVPTMEIREVSEAQELALPETTLGHNGFTQGVWVKNLTGTFELRDQFTSIGRAAHWVAFMSGESHDYEDN